MHEALFSQARTLATLDPRRPKQANLRRALSSAYYAVFHFLVQETCGVQIGSQHAQAGYRHVLGRAFSHTVMKHACAAFGGGTLKAAATKGLPAGFTVPSEVQSLARIFARLQEKRHLADYDLSERFDRSDVLIQINEAQRGVARFTSLASSDEKRFFLACLWAWKELTNR